MTPADIPVGLHLCRAAGWNQLEPDWRFFLESSPAGCSVVEEDGRVVGTVTTLRYGWISMVLVDPEFRHRGIGTMLLQEALKLLSDVETVRLDASPAGKPIYDKLGFLEEYPLSRLTSPPPSVAHALMRAAPALMPAPQVSPTTAQDLPRILNLDREIFGADRSTLLRYLYARAPEYAFVSGDAYCFGRPGHSHDHIGPVVSPGLPTAQALIAACLASRPRPHVLDVPDSASLLQNWLCSSNFAPERPFTRMYRGPHRSPGIPSRQFAIAGPEFG